MDVEIGELKLANKLAKELVKEIRTMAASLDGVKEAASQDLSPDFEDDGNDLEEEDDDVPQFALASSIRLAKVPGVCMAFLLYWKDPKNVLDWLMIGADKGALLPRHTPRLLLWWRANPAGRARVWPPHARWPTPVGRPVNWWSHESNLLRSRGFEGCKLHHVRG